MNTTNLLEQFDNLAQALDLQRHRVPRGQGFHDYFFFGLDGDTADLSRALCRLGLQHTKSSLGGKRVVVVKFIWTPERIK